MKIVGVKMVDEFHKKVKIAAIQADVSLNDFIVKAIEEKLDEPVKT